MPPAPPSPPLSYTTAPAVLPYTLRFHPYRPSSSPNHTHRLCVGAAVLAPAPAATPRILLLRRSAREKSLPHRWELPGGGADAPDRDALAAAARELWEETGLRAARFVALVGCYQWEGAGPGIPATAVPGDQAWGLAGGGVGVGVVEASSAAAAAEGADATAAGAAGRDAWRKYTYLVEVEAPAGEEGAAAAEVVVDPEEHDAFVWATEEEVRAGRCGRVVFEWTSDAQRLDVLRAFEVASRKR
ncbi:NUDIX domain-containing protein [Colletotrichum graminicola]|uniref:NUDIX domain-containing protein n=1 Tax=Colletotrichum graminicola (strain M1.001 / M2 / FGSC 10212) TaxID=645133 RepID=E3Q7H6_COLGM|nr:NUDIX domain-containing protein [Colletotrichum graminicola M1.001]EFQ26814.1 NUDIX domain-containing protein [Colletotrichum graminicola M1.001]WDK17633.1 NUDIX domain-containing protein [Colletotrichum graminicola]